MSDDHFMSRTALFAHRILRWPDDVNGSPPETDTLAEELLHTEVRIRADCELTSRRDVQLALLTTVNLVSRMGFQVNLQLDSAPVHIQHPLLPSEASLGEGLSDLPSAVRPEPYIAPIPTKRVAGVVEVGQSTSSENIGLAWTPWSGETGTGRCLPDQDIGPGLGPIVASHLASLEVFKAAIRSIARQRNLLSPQLDSDVEPSTPRLSLRDHTQELSSRRDRKWTRPKVDLENTLFVSAGAMTNATLFALIASSHLRGTFAASDPDELDEPDLNRYSLSLASDLERAKTDIIAERCPDSTTVVTHPNRYQDLTDAQRRCRLAVVGVDDIPTRAEVQREWPPDLLCGATQGQATIVSRHTDTGRGACCECIHPPEENPDANGEAVPTLAPVTGLAGTALAAEIIKSRSLDRKMPSPVPGGTRIDVFGTLQLARPLNHQRSEPIPDPNCHCGRAADAV